MNPHEWMLQGACRHIPDPQIMDPGRNGDMGPGKTVCRSCPVLEVCNEYALSLEPRRIAGIVGGMTGRERIRARQELGHGRQGAA